MGLGLGFRVQGSGFRGFRARVSFVDPNTLRAGQLLSRGKHVAQKPAMPVHQNIDKRHEI